ncbi:hypothetical protein ACHAWT_000278 [Skeletonema menzelii]
MQCIEHSELANQIRNPKMPHKCPMLLSTHAPWEMIKAKDVSCLCINCEGMNALLRGVSGALTAINIIVNRIESSNDILRDFEREVRRLLTIKEIINMPSKYDMCVEVLQPCLTSRKLEDAEEKCLDGTCPTCGFQRWWSRTLRKKLFITPSLGAESILNDDSPLVGAELKEPGIYWRIYTHEPTPTPGNHAQDVARQAAAARAAGRDDVDANDEEYNPNENAMSRRLCLATKQGTLVDFLDTLESMLKKHVIHRNRVAVERRAQLQWEHNVRPLMAKRDMDYSENGPIKDNIQVQSQHWGSNQYTLFVSIVTWLLVDEWNKDEGKLDVGNEVTVNGEMSTEEFNVDAFYARVTKVLNDDMYEVTDVNNYTTNHHRRSLRLRKRHSVAIGHVSDDKTHDRHSMQHFTNQELPWLEGYMKEKFPNDIPDGHIKIFQTHSDNAAQHFKNTGAMEFYSSLSKERGGAAQTAYVYNFGAPGHGKGPYDGIGGRWKSKIDQCIVSSTTKGPLSYTPSRYIQNAEDVHAALVHHFEKAEVRNVQLAGKNPIHKYKFFLNTFDNNPIERPHNEQFFAIASEGVVNMRQNPCWCPPCMKTLTQPSSLWRASPYRIPRCQSLSRSHNASNSTYEFTKHSCMKTAGRGVADNIRHERATLNEVCAQLTIGEWIIFHGKDVNGNEDPDQPLWLGRVMPHPEWSGQGVLKNTTGRATKYDMGIEVQNNEVATYVQWYEKIDLNSDERKYRVNGTNAPSVQNNQLLLHTGLKMQQLTGEPNPVARSRPGSGRQQRAAATASSSLGAYAPPRQNNQSSYESWHDKEYGIVWEMTKADRDYALSKREL